MPLLQSEGTLPPSGRSKPFACEARVLRPAPADRRRGGGHLAKIPQFENWTSSVRQYAYEQAVTYDKKWPSFKLVESKTNRKFSDEQAVSETLSLEGFGRRQNLQKTQRYREIEKLVGKDRFAPLLGSFVVKPEGQPTLVPESDKKTRADSGMRFGTSQKRVRRLKTA